MSTQILIPQLGTEITEAEITELGRRLRAALDRVLASHKVD